MLNPSQRRSLEVEMRLLEGTLRDLLDLLRRPPRESILTHLQSLPNGNRARLESLFEDMLREIGAVVEDFGLESHNEEVGRLVGAEMSGAWSDLHELLAKKLARYGPVDPALAPRLDPHIRRLIRMTLQAGRLAGAR